MIRCVALISLIAFIALVIILIFSCKKTFIPMLAWIDYPYSYGVDRIKRECKENCYTFYRDDKNADKLMHCLYKC